MYKDLSDDQRAAVVSGIATRRDRVLARGSESWVVTGARGARRVAVAAPTANGARMADLLCLGFRREDAELLLALAPDDLAKCLPSSELFFLAMAGGSGLENTPQDPARYVRTLAEQAGVVLPQGFGEAGQTTAPQSGNQGQDTTAAPPWRPS